MAGAIEKQSIRNAAVLQVGADSGGRSSDAPKSSIGGGSLADLGGSATTDSSATGSEMTGSVKGGSIKPGSSVGTAAGRLR
jgi:hypothetical protein